VGKSEEIPIKLERESRERICGTLTITQKKREERKKVDNMPTIAHSRLVQCGTSL